MIGEVGKHYLMQVAARNLSAIMRALFGVGKPRELTAVSARIFALYITIVEFVARLRVPLPRPLAAIG